MRPVAVAANPAPCDEGAAEVPMGVPLRCQYAPYLPCVDITVSAAMRQVLLETRTILFCLGIALSFFSESGQKYIRVFQYRDKRFRDNVCLAGHPLLPAAPGSLCLFGVSFTRGGSCGDCHLESAMVTGFSAMRWLCVADVSAAMSPGLW